MESWTSEKHQGEGEMEGVLVLLKRSIKAPVRSGLWNKLNRTLCVLIIK